EESSAIIVDALAKAARTPGLLPPSIQSCDPERVRCPRCLREAGAAHALQHLRRLGKALHGCGQISVGPFYAGNERAYCRQHTLEVNPVKLPDEATGLAEIQNAAFSSRAQNAHDLTQASVVVSKITEAERRRDQVESRVGEGQAQRVGFHPAH